MRSYFFFHLGAHLFGQALTGDEGHLEEEVLAQVQALFLGLLGQVHEEAGRAHIAGDAQLLHDVQLGGGIGGTGGDDRAAQVAQGLFEHQAGRGQLVVEGVLHGITGTEAHGIEGFGIAPVVLAAVFGVEDGPGERKMRFRSPMSLVSRPPRRGPMDCREDEFLFLEDGDVLDIGQGLELLHVELRTVEAFLDVFGVAVGVGEQVLELDQAILTAFAFVEHFTAAVDAFGTVFTSHTASPCRILFGTVVYAT